MIEKWLMYYYPLLESKETIPQIHGGIRLQFEIEFLATLKSGIMFNLLSIE